MGVRKIYVTVTLYIDSDADPQEVVAECDYGFAYKGETIYSEIVDLEVKE